MSETTIMLISLYLPAIILFVIATIFYHYEGKCSLKAKEIKLEIEKEKTKQMQIKKEEKQ